MISVRDFYKTVTLTILQMGGGEEGARREEKYRQEEGDVSFIYPQRRTLF